MSYSHKTDYILRYSDLDFKDELKPSSYLALAQESAGLSADELGFGYEALIRRNLGFVIVNNYCEILKPIRFGETVTVETWPLPPRMFLFERDYRFTVNGEIRANVASRWCLVDLETFNMQPPARLGETHENCPYRADKSVEMPTGKLPKLGEDAHEIYRLRVGNSHLDHHVHANNARYADFFFDCFSEEEMRRGIENFRVVYVRQSKEGSELALFRRDEEGRTLLECRSAGEPIAQCAVSFTKR